MTGTGMMTRREVAVMFGVTSEAVARWQRAGLLRGERGADGKVRYPRADVEALYRSGQRGTNTRSGRPRGRPEDVRASLTRQPGSTAEEENAVTSKEKNHPHGHHHDCSRRPRS